MTNRRSVANFLQGIHCFVRYANIDIIITDIIGGTNFTPLRLSKMLPHFDHLPLRSAMPIQDMNIHSAISSSGNNTSTPIYWRRRIHILNRRGGSNLQDEHSVYMASPN
jgi:hypothetical protein